MTCRYCTTQNEQDDHRCKRCGRRLHTDARPFPASNSSLAAVYEPDAQEMESPQPQPQLGPRVVPPQPQKSPGEPRKQPIYQASLFGPQEVAVVREAPAPRTRPVSASGSAAKPTRERPSQRSLEFPDPDKAQPCSVQSSIYCNAMVAPAPLRVAAVVCDLFFPAVATGLFWGALQYSGQDIPLMDLPLWMYAAIVLLVTALYKTLFCLGNNDTPGVRWAGLKLLDFDGRRPTREQRVKRLFAGAISIVAAGLGVIWAVLDEEKLTWHDHMSKTFATIADQSLFAAHR